ncbi:tRNA pseudouridine(38-40) synthase TruA [Butyrivibrio sp. LC3010]|uniref:tRNA pseudouridine(38-40) synthase TruA n=1 Tax=Butyrivibrio sp. LC3010 TaxID=1280680 RepID=UPI0004050E2F|nr:tRNA pseudouridine(38-40) synthase TruA [Butyrivibrio sp. LC3010]
MKNIMITVAYDGANYHGFAFQENVATIEGTIKNAIDNLTGEDSEIIGASRTDAGVHAYGNIVVFKTESSIPAVSFAAALNSKLPDDIRIMKSEEVPLDFHPRKCVSEKTYEYRILNTKTLIPTKRLYTCHCSYDLDEKLMHEAAQFLVGEHDFSSFCSAGSQALSHVRKIISCDVSRHGDEVVIRIIGNGFLYNMVRIIAGTLMDIGRGKGVPSDIKDIIDARDRAAAGPTAPPQGLFLIKYNFLQVWS